MQASDLRSGNIVKNDSLDVFKKGFIQIHARHIAEIAVYNSAQTGDSWVKHFNPVLISKQWFYELGFKPDNDESSELVKNGFHIIELPDGSFEFFNHDYAIKIYYVHQLQNLYYSLMNEELISDDEIQPYSLH